MAYHNMGLYQQLRQQPDSCMVCLHNESCRGCKFHDLGQRKHLQKDLITVPCSIHSGATGLVIIKLLVQAPVLSLLVDTVWPLSKAINSQIIC